MSIQRLYKEKKKHMVLLPVGKEEKVVFSKKKKKKRGESTKNTEALLQKKNTKNTQINKLKYHNKFVSQFRKQEI